MIVLVPIVEGHGDKVALPVLLHRLAPSGADAVRVNPPIRVKASSFLNDEAYFARYIELAGAKAAQANGRVLILLDCEDDCPGQVGPRILERARAVRSDVDIVVALAYREYETWFLAAARSLRGQRGLSSDLEPPPDPERIRDAKGWLTERMTRPYDEVVHQVEFTRVFDLAEARTNPSFRRLSERVRALFEGTP
jgi:hypothetical protein